jgi:hypothetical protein
VEFKRLETLASVLTALATVAAVVLAGAATAQNVGWRTDGDGRYPDTDPPTSWSATENVKWKTPLPESSNASPVLLPRRLMVVVLAEPDEILALSTEDGSIAWKDSVADVTGEKVKTHDANGWTSATPVSDGSRVFTVFGSGVVAAHDVTGKRLWARKVQEPAHRWGHSASPVLADGNLIVHLVDLFALNPATGEEVWRVASEVVWGSPVVTRVGRSEVVITPSGDVFRADTGEKVASEIGKLAYATPVVQDGVIYFIEKRATAVKLPDALDKPWETLWESRIEGSRHYASALIHDGLVYAVSREEDFSILDAATGEVVHARKLDLGEGGNSAYPSLSLAGGKIYLSVENGTTAVLEPGRAYQEIARSSIAGFRSSPVFFGNRMYVRAFDGLWCFASAEEASRLVVG